MDITDLLSHFAVALGIGLLIGIERGWRTRDEKPGSRTAGVRTFTIIGLLGGTTGVLAEAAGTPLTMTGGLVIARSLRSLCRDLCDDVPRRKPRRQELLGNDGHCRHADLCALGLCDDRRHARSRRGGGRDCRCARGARTAPRLAHQDQGAGNPQRSHPACDDLHCPACDSERTDRPLGRGQSARNLADRHRPRRRVIRGLCGGEGAGLARMARCSLPPRADSYRRRRSPLRTHGARLREKDRRVCWRRAWRSRPRFRLAA